MNDMNERILALFQNRQEQYVSGEELSRILNCSRTAVWKHIRKLREQGYEFESAPRLGYRLKLQPEPIDTARITGADTLHTMGKTVHYYDKVLSTQATAQQWAVRGAEEGTLIISDLQTAGRGRMGRSWFSPAGKGIWMSLILKPRIPLQFMPQLTLLIAVALCKTIRQYTGVDAGIKWPNDLLVGGRKISGILLESAAEDERITNIIAGIGISANLSAEDYPQELKPIATSLLIESGAPIDRTGLIVVFLEHFETLYELFHREGFAPIRLMWEAMSVTLERTIAIRTQDGPREGKAVSIDEHGALVVRLKDGSTVKMYSGDVEFPT